MESSRRKESTSWENVDNYRKRAIFFVAILAQAFPEGSNFLCFVTLGEVDCGCLCGVVCLCRDPGDCPSFWCFGMVSDGFQTQGRGSWIPGKERAEPILAGAVEIDGRKDCICKFSPIVGRGGVAEDVTTASRAAGKVPAGNCGEKRRLVQGLPSSSGEEDKNTNSQESEIPELREQVGWSCEQRGEAEGQSCPARR